MDKKNKLVNKVSSYIKIEKAGNVLLSSGTPTFIISILSPFEFEGPIIEIATSSAIIVGLILKLVGKSNLKKLKSFINDNEKLSEYLEVTEETALEIASELNKMILDKKPVARIRGK